MAAESGSLGEFLRAERERRQISLQEISAVTKIQRKFLEALEQDRYDDLPPTPFVLGFLRAYAQCLALDPDAVVAAYHARHRPPEEAQGTVVPRAGGGISRKMRLLGLAALLGALALLAGLVLRSGRQAPPTEPTAASTAAMPGSTPSPLPAESPAPPLPVAAPPQTPTEAGEPPPALPANGTAQHTPAATEAPAPPPPPPTPLVLHVRALEDTWLRVEIDGEKRHALLLTAGKDIRWEATERFVLTVGNVQGTRLSLNGQDIPLPQTRSNVVRNFLLTRELLN
ncbi:MAG: hypothetical protein KatS3mg131_0819 [Candidatus Tectimicrobiota bacterium]|nr:MAG: hypothetical protein KatS3mg131_0819 [Candidatus Tectomicrobia bacterium]